MEVENVHIDYIFVDEGVGKSKAIRYEFGEKRWVSTHTGRDGKRLGPITQLEDKGDNQDDDSSVIEFGEYTLPIEEEGDETVISYTDTWTIPPSSIYVLVLPPGFIGDYIAISHSNNDEDSYFNLNKGVGDEGRIFYTCTIDLFGGPVDIQARIEQDEDRYEKEVEDIGRVINPEDEVTAYQRVKNNLPSASSVSLLLELRKLFGIP